MTGPYEPPPPRSRSGLAKLRGAPTAVTESAPAAAPEPTPDLPVETWAAGSVNLTKSAQQQWVDPQVPVQGATPVREGSRRGVLIVASALLVAIAALLVVVLVNPFDSATKPATGAGSSSGGTADERLAVVRSARQFTVSFFTYDYRKMDVYYRRIEAASSGDFRKDFVSKEKTLTTVVTQLKTVATGQVPDAGAGLVSMSGDNATALVAANFNASNAVTQNGQKRYRVKIALQRVKGVWLVTNFDQVV